MQFSDEIPRGCWSSADFMKSFTFREVKAIRLVLKSYSDLHQTNNRNAAATRGYIGKQWHLTN